MHRASGNRKLLFERKTIGHPDCPLFKRTNIVRFKSGLSLRVHQFFSNADDRDVHDHPWWFITFVLRGGYTDMIPCKVCNGDEGGCPWCGHHEQGLAVGTNMRPGTIRFRSANHRHRTMVNPTGCTTLVITGPVSRRWGFWRTGEWYPWRKYNEIFGPSHRCD